MSVEFYFLLYYTVIMHKIFKSHIFHLLVILILLASLIKFTNDIRTSFIKSESIKQMCPKGYSWLFTKSQNLTRASILSFKGKVVKLNTLSDVLWTSGLHKGIHALTIHQGEIIIEFPQSMIIPFIITSNSVPKKTSYTINNKTIPVKHTYDWVKSENIHLAGNTFTISSRDSTIFINMCVAQSTKNLLYQKNIFITPTPTPSYTYPKICSAPALCMSQKNCLAQNKIVIPGKCEKSDTICCDSRLIPPKQTTCNKPKEVTFITLSCKTCKNEFCQIHNAKCTWNTDINSTSYKVELFDETEKIILAKGFTNKNVFSFTSLPNHTYRCTVQSINSCGSSVYVSTNTSCAGPKKIIHTPKKKKHPVITKKQNQNKSISFSIQKPSLTLGLILSALGTFILIIAFIF